MRVNSQGMRTLCRNVLRKLGKEFQRREDLEIPLRPRLHPVSLRIGKGSAGLLLGLVNHLPGFTHLDQPRKTGGGRGRSSLMKNELRPL